MNKSLFFIIAMLISTSVFAASYHRGYTRKSGTYVAPHYQTKADHTRLNNYSTKGNVNPYTGKKGTVNPYRIRTK